jgi:hypothetical protein
MARPQKEGLDYFPLDVDMDQDDKLFFIEAKHGLIGFAIVIRLLMQIYKEGYYKHYSDDKDAFLLSKRLSVCDFKNSLVQTACASRSRWEAGMGGQQK